MKWELGWPEQYPGSGYHSLQLGIERGFRANGIGYSIVECLQPIDKLTPNITGVRRGTKWHQHIEDTMPQVLPTEDKRTRPDVARVNVSVPMDWEWHGAGFRIGYTMWESSKLPENNEFVAWKPWLETADVVAVPSPHCKTVINEALPNLNVVVVPLAVERADFPYINRPSKSQDEPFNFLMCGDLSFRKGWDIGLYAFFEEFGNDPRARMLVKVRGQCDWNSTGGYMFGRCDAKTRREYYDNRSNWSNRIVGHDNIKVYRGTWRRSSINRLYQMSDCFVAPTRGEGYGLPWREGAATGMPVITSSHTGHFDAENWARVVGWDYSIEDAFFQTWGYCGKWYVPRIEEVRREMRFAFENRERVRKDAMVASEYVTRRTWQDVVSEILSIIN